MSRMSPGVERQVRIEMLRARAAIEREALAQRIVEAGHALSPANLVRGLVPGLGGRMGRGRGSASSMLWQAVSLARRYPLVSSSLSTLVLGGSRRSRLLKLAGVGLAGWQLYKTWRGSSRA